MTAFPSSADHPPGRAPKRALAKSHRHHRRPPFECIALLLQGGGALGAYQGGVYQGLAEAGLHPDWVAGISIGGINSALIAGNPPETRVDRLRAFWEGVTAQYGEALGEWRELLTRGDLARGLWNQFSAACALFHGVPGFFSPRQPPLWLQPSGCVEATSYYDIADLRPTIERLIDFDRINSGETRLSLGAVNVRTGNFVYFDTATHTIRPEHVMASGALPPGFPAVEIDGEHYWDGGLVSNTPLDWVVESQPTMDTLAFQVDLWSARGEFPRTIVEAMTRLKEIQYSSRTRSITDRFKYSRKIRNMIASLIDRLPADMQNSTEAEFLRSCTDHKVYNIVHLIYRTRKYEGQSKDYEFSRLSMEEHWRAGYNDTIRTLRHPEVLERPHTLEGVSTFDLARDGRE